MTVDIQVFKQRLLEFVEEREEPFDANFLVKTCNQPVSYITVHEALFQLEDEGQLVRLDNEYLPTRVMMKRWLKPGKLGTGSSLVDSASSLGTIANSFQDSGMSVPKDLFFEIAELLHERPELGYVDVEEFLRDAIRRHVREMKKKRS